MAEFNNMSIDELQAELAKAKPAVGSYSNIETILISKSLKYLSDEIAVFKEASCLESKALRESTKVVSEKLVEIVQAVSATSDKLLAIVGGFVEINKNINEASGNAKKYREYR